MLKVDFHTHTADDPADRIPYTTHALIERAAAHGYDALAITLHDAQLDLSPFERTARACNVVLLPGIERTIAGRHVLLINFSRAAESVCSFDDLARLKACEQGLVIAPHPYFPIGTALRDLAEPHAHLFDAVEVNAMFTRAIDFNERARAFAAAHGLPLVGNGDIHRLEQLDTTYALVDAARNAADICAAVIAGRVRVEAQPLTITKAARIMTDLVVTSVVPRRNSRRSSDTPALSRS